MTERLYYEDARLLSFDAVVTKAVPSSEKTQIWLDRTAFYPTSGGQPYDTGTINGRKVIDVDSVDGDVVHTIEGELEAGEKVHCEIDPVRRRDHMQQHCADHMLAHLLYVHYGAFTHGLHISGDISTIDVTFPDGRTHLSEDEIIALEEEVNDWITQDEPIKCWFPSPEELETLPMRKAPTVDEHIRVVWIAPDEYCACGGTHPLRTGEVGCMRIIDTKPARGKMRVSFLAGMRAVRDNRSKTDAALKAANTLSSSWSDLPAAVSRLREKCAELSSDIRDLRRKLILLELEKCTPSVSADGRSIYTCIFNGEDVEALRDAAGAFAADHDAYVLCASETDSSSLLVFVRGGNCTQNVGSLLSSAAKANGGKGGGRPEFAQGSAANAEGALRQAEESLRS